MSARFDDASRPTHFLSSLKTLTLTHTHLSPARSSFHRVSPALSRPSAVRPNWIKSRAVADISHHRPRVIAASVTPRRDAPRATCSRESVIMHAFAPFANASATPTVRQTTSKRQQTSSRSNAIARVVRANARSNDAEDAVGDATTRRRAIATLFAGAVGTAGAVGSAKADVQDYLSNLLVEKPPPPKREILLPDLEVKPLTREEGYRGTTGANKSKAQIEFAQFIAPIIEENIDMDFGSYFRLALADLGTFSVVGKKNGLNGSIRFELDRPENAGLKPAFESIEKIKKAVDAKTTQPITYADLIAIVPHFAARRQFKADYMEEVGDDKNYEFLFIGTNPFLGAKIRIGRRDADGPDPEGLIPLVDGNAEDFIAWFRRMGLGPNELAALAPYIYEDRQKGIDICAQDGTCARLLDVYETQRILGKRAPGPAVTIIKNLKQCTDQCIPGGPLSVAPAQLDPLYVDYAFIKGGGEIPRISASGAYPGSIYDSGSKLAMQLRASQAEQRAQAAAAAGN